MADRKYMAALRSRRKGRNEERAAEPGGEALPGIDLLAVSGLDVGRRFSIFASEAVLVGPAAGSEAGVHTIALRDEAVSPCQAVIRRVGLGQAESGDSSSGGQARAAEFEIEHDASAARPTLVNGSAVERCAIGVGDRIAIGGLTLEVHERDPRLSGIFEITADRREEALGGQATQLTATGAAGGYFLRVLRGSLERCYEIGEGDTLIGRADRCAVCFANSPRVSREHARIERNGDELVLVHLSGTNTTRVNGEAPRARSG